MFSKVRVSRGTRTVFSVLASLMLVLGLAGVVNAASDGAGDMVVNPTTATAGATAQTFTFDFSNGTSRFSAGSAMQLTIPALWTAPTLAAGNGQITVANLAGGNCNPSITSITGMVILIAQRCGQNNSFRITYSGVTVPVAGTYTFATASQEGNAGMTALASGSPTVTVSAPIVPQLVLVKLICTTYTAVPANANAATYDATGGHGGGLGAAINTTVAYPADNPGGCTPAAGWDFTFSTGDGGTTPVNAGTTYRTGADGTLSVPLTGTLLTYVSSASQANGLWVREVTQDTNAGFGSIRCYNNKLYGDNLETIWQNGGGGVPATTYCIAYNVKPLITFPAIANRTYGAANFNLGVTSTSPVTITYTSTGPCTVSTTGVVTVTGAGTCTITAHQAGQATPFWAPAADQTRSFDIAKANATCVVTNYNVAYDSFSHTATGSCTGVGGVVLTGLNLTGTTHTAVGTYNGDAWNFADVTGNYNNASGTVNDAIGKATPTCVVTPYNVTYDGNAHSATGSCTGVGGVVLAGLVITSTHTNAGTYAADTWTFTDATGTYNNASGTITDRITKATATCAVTAYNTPFTGTAHTATGSCTGVKGETLAGLNLAGTTHTAVGTYNNDPWTFTDVTGNYNNRNGTVNDVITKPAPSCTITPYNVTFDGAAHTATGVCRDISGNPIAGLVISGTTHTNAGDYAADAWTFHDATGTYADASGTVHDVIAKANAVCSVVAYSVTFDATAHTAGGTGCTGVGGASLAGLNVSGTTHTNAGDYAADPWTFTDVTGNYNNTSGTVHDVIAKATPTCSVVGYSVTYDGNAHTAGGAGCTGIGGVGLAGLNLTGTTHTNAGDYSGDAWSFHDASGNYADASGTVDDSIGQAKAACLVTPYSVTYDGAAHTAGGSCLDLNDAPLAGLVVTGTTHTAVGDYPADAWSFHDASGNYGDQSGTVHDSIGQARPVCTVTGYNVTFDGNAHTATGSCLDINGDPIAGIVLSATTHTNAGDYTGDAWSFHDATGTYADASGTVDSSISQAKPVCTVTGYDVAFDGAAHSANGSCLDVNGDPLAGLALGNTTHTAVGAYDGDSWIFHDIAGNYSDASGTVDDAITQAKPVCTVTAYNVTFNGAAHSATGSCVDVNGDPLAGLTIDSTHTNAGDYGTDSWSFHDASGTYSDASGTLADSIAKADATCSITAYAVPFDGAAHTATGSCLDINGDPLAGLALGGTTHSTLGDFPTDPWTFTDSTGNYNDASGTVHDAIGQAKPVCTVTAYNVTFNGAAHSATGSCVDVNGDPLAGLTIDSTHTNAGDYGTDSWSFHDASGTYSDASGTLADSIAKAAPACSVTGYNVIYNGAAHTATGECLDLNDNPIAGLDLSGTTHTDIGIYNGDPWSIAASENYNAASGTVNDRIQTQPTDPNPALSIVKTSDKDSFKQAGDVITYTYTVTNTGNVTLTGQVSVSDNKIDGGTQFVCGAAATLAPGDSVQCTKTYTITTADVTAGTVTNTAQAFAGFTESTISSATTAVTVTLESVGGETDAPNRTPTPPVTSSSTNHSSNDALPLFVILIALAFGGLGLLAVQAQNRAIRR